MADIASPPTADLDFLDELDAAISKITRKSGLEARRKAALSRAANYRAPLDIRNRAKLELAEIKLELEALVWQPVACVALFSEQSCTYCASKHRMFLQHMVKETTFQTKAPTTRWHRVNRPISGLPREVIIQKSATHMCVDCCSDFDYSFAGGEVKFQSESPFTISADYHQEEVDDTLSGL